MSRALDPYTILGIDPAADDDAVKRAYRRGVLAWHPDVSSAPDACEKLREVQWAWEMIGEPERRRGWDQQAAREREPPPQHRPREHFWTRHRHRRADAPSPASSRDLFVEIELTAEEVARGMVVPIEVPFRVPCDECSARRGRTRFWRLSGDCLACAGSGIRTVTRTFEVTVPQGADDGAHASVWLEEGRSKMHIVLRIV